MFGNRILLSRTFSQQRLFSEAQNFYVPFSELWPVKNPVTSLQCFLSSNCMSCDRLIPRVVAQCLRVLHVYKVLTLSLTTQVRLKLLAEVWSMENIIFKPLHLHPVTLTRDPQKHDHILQDRTQCLPTFPDKPSGHLFFPLRTRRAASLYCHTQMCPFTWTLLKTSPQRLTSQIFQPEHTSVK